MIRTYNRAFCQMLKRFRDIYEVLSIFLNYALRPTKVTPVVVLIIEILACELCDSVIDRLKVELKKKLFYHMTVAVSGMKSVPQTKNMMASKLCHVSKTC